MNQNETQGIWVFVELNHDEIHSSTLELLNKAQALTASLFCWLSA